MSIELNAEQTKALETIEDWYNNGEQVFRLFGCAGSGKTTLSRFIPSALNLDTYYYSAYTGKATNVLRSKGCRPAHTLHSLVYGAPLSRKKRLNTIREYIEANPDEHDIIKELKKELEQLKRDIALYGDLDWVLNEESPLTEAELVILDEVSMVNDQMADDILRYGCKILVLGDPEQLPPIHGEGAFTRVQPDVLLKEVQRFESMSYIDQLATRVRLSDDRSLGLIPGDLKSERDWIKYDQVLCWRRNTRWTVIDYIRTVLGRPPGIPVKDDRIICLSNNKTLQVFNGQTFTVLDVKPSQNNYDDEVLLHLEDEQGVYRVIDAYLAGFQGLKAEKTAESKRLGSSNDSTGLFTFSNALTVHKAQGSQYGSVLIMDETASLIAMTAKRASDREAVTAARRWLYTAVTRAENTVTIHKMRRR